MTRKKESLDDLLRSAKLLITNARDDAEAARALARFGYDTARLAVGTALLEEAAEAHRRQKKEYGDQYEATEEVQTAWEAADDRYGKTRKVARIALRGHTAIRTATRVDEPRNASLSGWTSQAETFYARLLADPEAVTAMAKFGYPATTIADEYALVRGLADKDARQKRERGEALESTQARDRKIDALSRWTADLRAIARIAFADAPLKLKSLGVQG